MMGTYLITIGLLFMLMVIYIGVERFYRWFAATHPDRGPWREKAVGCGTCEKKKDCADAH
jgi:hypothetical protein